MNFIFNRILANFNEEFLNEINECRVNPSNYARKIEEYLQYVKPNPEPKPGANFLFIFLNYPKISLSKGKEAFTECINELNKIKPMHPLKNVLMLNLTVPTTSDNWVKKQIVSNMILHKKDEVLNKYDILQFHYDIGGLNPVIMAMLQIIDDNITFNMTRRKNLLDDDFNSIGISNYNIGKKVCVYLLFGKSVPVPES